MDLNALLLFAKIVEQGSFSEAARRLNMPVSTVSRKIAELENNLGVRLLERSTRKLRLTDIGADILSQAQQSAEIDEAVTSIVSNQLNDITGALRLSAPPNISDSLLAPIITAFQARYPGVRVQVMITHRFVDPITEGIDVAFRVGRMENSALVRKTVLHYRHQLVASPAYLALRAPVCHPNDLLSHRLIAFSFWTPKRDWTFRRGNDEARIEFEPHLEMNDYSGLATALLSGAGIGDLPPVVLPALVESGQLVEVMPEWNFRPLDLSLVHLGKRHMRRPVRLFVDYAVEAARALFPNLPQ